MALRAPTMDRIVSVVDQTLLLDESYVHLSSSMLELAKIYPTLLFVPVEPVQMFRYKPSIWLQRIIVDSS